MSSAGSKYHVPVMAEKVIELLLINKSGVYLDATAGGGGFCSLILQNISRDGLLVGIDQDEDAIRELKERISAEVERFVVVRENFRMMASNDIVLSHAPYDGILFDYGVSSFQLDTGLRGFSHRFDGPLDMRMDRRNPLTAEIVVNEYDREDLISIFREYGEEKRAVKIAKAIESSRKIATTNQLAEVVRKSVPTKEEAKSVMRIFQAIRIEVNQEMQALEESLPAAYSLLKQGGRIVAMSYHSLEDKRVKDYFRSMSQDCTCPSGLPCTCGGNNAKLKMVTRKPIMADAEEKDRNPRSHSVRIRVAERIG